LIQGAGLHGNGWKPQADALCARFQCLTFDNRGMGGSQPAAKPITVEQMANDTFALMDSAGITSAHIVGHSMGGAVAQEIALTMPTRVRSLSLLCTSAIGTDATRITWEMAWLATRTRVGTRRMRRLAMLKLVLSPEGLAKTHLDKEAERLAPLFGHDLADTPPIVMQQLWALKRFDASQRLHQLARIPTLVIGAANDIIFPLSCSRKLADAIPGARLVEIPNAAHGVAIELAEEVNRLLAEHIERTISL